MTCSPRHYELDEAGYNETLVDDGTVYIHKVRGFNPGTTPLYCKVVNTGTEPDVANSMPALAMKFPLQTENGGFIETFPTPLVLSEGCAFFITTGSDDDSETPIDEPSAGQKPWVEFAIESAHG